MYAHKYFKSHYRARVFKLFIFSSCDTISTHMWCPYVSWFFYHFNILIGWTEIKKIQQKKYQSRTPTFCSESQPRDFTSLFSLLFFLFFFLFHSEFLRKICWRISLLNLFILGTGFKRVMCGCVADMFTSHVKSKNFAQKIRCFRYLVLVAVFFCFFIVF